LPDNLMRDRGKHWNTKHLRSDLISVLHRVV